VKSDRFEWLVPVNRVGVATEVVAHAFRAAADVVDNVRSVCGHVGVAAIDLVAESDVAALTDAELDARRCARCLDYVNGSATLRKIARSWR
jgi:hypothetical protein